MEKLIRELQRQLKSEMKDEFLLEFSALISRVEALETNLLERNSDIFNRLTYKEISNQYKISIKTLGKLKKSGKLIPICKGGKSFIFNRADVEVCLRERNRNKPDFLDAS